MFVKELHRSDPLLNLHEFPSDSFVMGARLKIGQWWNELILPDTNKMTEHVRFLETTVGFYQTLYNAENATKQTCQLTPSVNVLKSSQNRAPCQMGAKCQNKETCKQMHSKIFECEHYGSKQNGLIYKCTVQPTDSLVFNFDVKDPFFSDPNFVIQSRINEPTRGILVLWKTHKFCSDIVKREEFWEIVIKLTQQACFGADYLEAVLVNFGDWDNGISGDTNMATCHGHAHVIITEKNV
jgi:hypothetical protein